MRFKPVYIIDGARSPFLKARNAPGPFSASELAVQTCRELLLRQPFAPSDLSEVITGCAAPSPDEVNIGRLVGLRLGTGHAVPGWTVMRNCASGMQALDSAIMSIQTGRSDLVLSIGVDALSHAPLLLSDELVQWLSRWNSSRRLNAKLKLLSQLKPQYLKPVIGLLKGLTDPTVGLSMGQTAENLAHQFGISRQDMDEYAVLSHQRAQQAASLNHSELIALVDRQGKLYDHDDGIRPDSTLAKLAQLRAVFDRPWGNITAGNSSQVSDGAAALILASEQAVMRHQLRPIGRILDVQWAGLDPATMGLGPVFAASPLLRRHGLGLNDIDLWEINEAFAAQVLACLAAWESESWCQEHLNSPAFGPLDRERLNIDGGAIALGHPVGASGARIVLHCLQALRQRQLKTGMAAICIGGGQGGAVLLETLDEVRT
ncbi:acetyl-CoA C-acetyltransferase [Alcaligenes endophyticus]|uniref:Acetyl-CoA C-acetyltransferase n=1 Tax=Alcaligenes endophyticus TaxID=1929088 RepID=A0ABT8EET8_9BURK|nr:acetyl-CoA C-acetyltransferase [Alcaligenes endophyticus]MCX5592355.1 acetyl-CoA C-acetyltransferase [Alcaligenes endophyticus]MDN4119798.1 acetyl-CoA C-acetyltransferase [Alcaligenes endophyticus]